MDPYYNPLSAIDNMAGPLTPTKPSPKGLTGSPLRHIQERINAFKTPQKQQSGMLQHKLRSPGSPPPSRLGSQGMMSIDRILNAEIYSPAKCSDFVAIDDDDICPVDYSSGYDADDEDQSSPRKEKKEEISSWPTLTSSWTPIDKSEASQGNSVPSADPFITSVAGSGSYGPIAKLPLAGYNSLAGYNRLFSQPEPISSKGPKTSGGGCRIDLGAQDSYSDDFADLISKMKERRENTLQVTTKLPIFQPPPPMSDGTEDSATLTESSHTMVASSGEEPEDQDVEDDWSAVDDEDFESDMCVDSDLDTDFECQKDHYHTCDDDDLDFCDRHDDKRQKIEDTQSSWVHVTGQVPYKVNPLYMAKYGGFSFPSTTMG